jgi:formylglycine-generating enzyme required for sulfatase activity
MRKKPENLPEDRVRLPPILGIKPGHYLAALYAVLGLIILFFVLVYPGLFRPGSLLVLKTVPEGAALRVDGVYMGTSPDRVFVPRGSHSLELSLPGFKTEKIDCEIPGRVFASALFPRLYPLSLTLPVSDPGAVFAAGVSDYIAWSFGGEPAAVWQIPLSLSTAVYRAGSAGEEILRASARFAVTRAALRDLIRAKTLSDNGGFSPSPLTLLGSARDIIGFLSETPPAAAWLADLLPRDSFPIGDSSWYRKQGAVEAVSSAGGRQISAGGLSFTSIEGGVLAPGGRYRIPVEGFLICNTEVAAADFERFLAAHPEWAPGKLDALAGQGLATSEYLAEDPEIASAARAAVTRAGEETGITGVSWFAAAAFCAWLSGELPASLPGYEARLPTEEEWEYAAKWARNRTAAGERVDIRGFGGLAWEWCGNPYAPLDFIRAPAGAVETLGSPERALRGGSWINPAGAVDSETRASLPPEFCSPFVSFRPVLAPKQGAGPNAAAVPAALSAGEG